MNQLRICFMGTPDFAVAILQDILKHKFNVVGVVTAPDKPAGRGRKLKASAVKDFAIKNNLKIYQPKNLKSESFEAQLKEMNPNLIVVVAFRMLPKKVWSFPSFGTFNLHASLLPAYRGAAPIHWAVINNEVETGVTTFFIDDKIDTGEIILSKSTPIKSSETTGEVYNRLMEIGGQAVIETLQLIQARGREVDTTAQDQTIKHKEAPKLTKENSRINWNNTSEKVYHLIRGLSPFPLSWTYLQENDKNLVCKFYTAEYSLEEHNLSPGAFKIENKQLYIACQKGFIIPKEIKLEGRKKMTTIDLLNGYAFADNAQFN